MIGRMVETARRAMVAVLGLEPTERVFVVTDEACLKVGESFLEAGRRAGAGGEMFVLPEENRPLKELPPGLLEQAAGASVGVTCFTGLAEETPFRLVLLRDLMKVCTRLGHAPGITREMMIGGAMDVEYEAMAKRAEMLMGLFRDADFVGVETRIGTSITLRVRDRAFQSDVSIPEGRWGNLPAGEIWCGPVEDFGDGVIICDGSIGDLGQVPAPVRIEIRTGQVVDVSCEDHDFAKRCLNLLTLDEWSDRIGELGIGLNPGARITGNLLEDEKAALTAHVAFGANLDMPGGQNRSNTHRDFLFHRPTITVRYVNGDRRTIMQDGETIEE